MGGGGGSIVPSLAWRPKSYDLWIFVWSALDFGDKNSSIFGEDFFFIFTWLGSREKNSGLTSFPQILKTGKNWAKIASYPPNAQHKSAPLILLHKMRTN